MANMIIDRDEAVLVLDSPINKKEALEIAKEIPDGIMKVNVLGNLDNLLELLLALEQGKYFINVDGKVPFDTLFKSSNSIVCFPAWMELVDTYTDHTSIPSSIFDLRKSIDNSKIVLYSRKNG